MKEEILKEYQLSKHAQEAVALREIKLPWINDTILDSDKFYSASDVEFHYYKKVGTKCLKVVVNPVYKKIITVYFDRTMNKRGCK